MCAPVYRQPARKVACDDGRGGAADLLHFGEKRTPNQPPRQHAQQDDGARGDDQPVPEKSFHDPEPGDVIADQEAVSARQVRTDHADVHPRSVDGGHHQVQAGRFRNPGRPGLQVAGKPRARTIREEQDPLAALERPAHPRIDRGDEPVGAGVPESLGQPGSVFPQGFRCALPRCDGSTRTRAARRTGPAAQC